MPSAIVGAVLAVLVSFSSSMAAGAAVVPQDSGSTRVSDVARRAEAIVLQENQDGPGQITKRLEIAAIHVLSGNTDDARRLISKAHELCEQHYPGDPYLLSCIAYSQADAGLYPEALSTIEQIQDEQQRVACLDDHYSLVVERVDDVEVAIRYVEKISRNTRKVVLYSRLAGRCFEQSEDMLAEPLLNRAVRIAESGKENNLFLLAVIVDKMAELQKREIAREIANRVLEIANDTGDDYALYKAQECFAILGDVAQVKSILGKSDGRRLKKGKMYIMAETYAAAEMIKEALQVAGEMRNESEGEPEDYYSLLTESLIASFVESEEGLRHALDLAMTIDYDEQALVRCLLLVATALHKEGKSDQSAIAFTRVADIVNNSPDKFGVPCRQIGHACARLQQSSGFEEWVKSLGVGAQYEALIGFGNGLVGGQVEWEGFHIGQ